MASKPILSSHPPFPEQVGKYELLLPIGTGGMATVYLARSSGVGGFERDVALKLVHSHLRTDEDSKLQLLEEAKLAARIRHPNVVPVLEVDEDPLGLFLVMDYVEGDTLSGLARTGRTQGKPLTLPLIGRILNDALLGLHAAHELTDTQGHPLNLVHRDFSPQNILVSVQGMTRLADFGVAKAANRAVRTKTGLIKGKISYMSPEQARGQAIDRRCDVWAAGVVAWELIAGRRMHRSDDDVATLLSIVTEDPPRLRAVVPGVPKALDDAVASALRPDVAKRCPTAEELRRILNHAFEQCGGMADAQDLGRYVQQIVGPKLEERRASVSEVRTLRRRMVELASARADEQSDAEAAGEPPTPPPAEPRTAGATSRDSRVVTPAPASGIARADGAVDAESPGATRPEEHTQTSATVPLFETVRRDRKRLVIGSIASLSLVAALGIGLGEWATKDGQEPLAEPPVTETPSATDQGAASAAVAISEKLNPVPSAEDEPEAPETEAAATTSAISTEPAEVAVPAKKPRVQPKPPSTPPRSPRKSRPKKPKLADSPYATPKSED